MNVNVLRYKHNDMEDLERRLQQAEGSNKLIVTDGVFSAFGSIAHMDKVKTLAEKYEAQVLVDDAHAFGVIGEGGRGTASEFGVDVADAVLPANSG